MPDTGFIAQHWNNALTILTSAAVLVIGDYQIHHYRAQSPNLSNIEVLSAEHRPAAGRGGRTKDGGYREGTRYILEIRISNNGREPTSISEATLFIDGTGEKLDLERYTGSTKVPIRKKGSFTPPRSVDESLRIEGNDDSRAEYRATGEPLENYSQTIGGTVRLKSVNGNTAEQAVTFVDAGA